MGNPDRPELADELGDTFCKADPEHARVFAGTTFLSDNRTDLARIPLPTLVIEAPRFDRAAGSGAYVHAQIPDSHLVTLAATGHCPHVSAPDATARRSPRSPGRRDRLQRCGLLGRRTEWTRDRPPGRPHHPRQRHCGAMAWL